MDWVFLSDAFLRIIQGLPLTLKLAGASLGAGIVLAVLLAAVRMSGITPLAWAVRGYVFVFRGTPLLVQLFLIYYGLGQFVDVRQSALWPFLRDAWWCALLALTLNTGAYGSEIVRGGLQAVPAGQIEAARAAGMSGFLLFRRITAPIALRQALPGYGNEIILMVKATALAGTVTLMEMTGIARKIGADTFRYVEALIVAGAIYLAINFLITRAIQLLEHRLSPHLRGAPTRVVLPVEVR